VSEDVAIALDVHPLLRPVRRGHDVRCWLYHDAAGNLMPAAEAALREGRSIAAATGASIVTAPEAVEQIEAELIEAEQREVGLE
jgi:hypothetical protein